MQFDLSSVTSWVVQQVATLQIMLARDAVQRQLLAIVIVLVLAWLLPKLVEVLISQLEPKPIPPSQITSEDDGVSAPPLPAPHTTWRERFLRWLRAFDYVLFPLIALVAFEIVIGQFEAQNQPYGLIESILPLLWLILGYRILIGAGVAAMPKESAARFTQRFVRPLLIFLLLFIATRILFNTLALNDSPLFVAQGMSFTLGNILYAAMAFAGFYALAWIVYELVRRVMKRNEAERGVMETVSNVSRYAVIAFGGLAALSVLGVDLATLGWIGTGLSVGIGFGLQELFGNFVSGIMLTFERSVRPGDVIETGGQRGTVTSVGMRSTVLRTSDNIEVFVPNKELLTKQMLAYTYTDRTSRVKINVGVAYGSDLEIVPQLLQQVLKSHPAILTEPAPNVQLIELGPYSLNYQLTGNVAEYRDAWGVRTDLLRMVCAVLMEHGIVMPYPRQEIVVIEPAKE